MNKILIVGAANLQHTVNFIDTLLIDNPENQISVFNTEYNCTLVPEIKSFYISHKVKIVNTENLSCSRNLKIRAILNLIKKSRMLHNECCLNKSYDMCFILYCSWQSSLWISMYYKYFKKVFLVYFGSDVLRNRKLTNYFFSKMNRMAESIILPNLNTLKFFNTKTNNKYATKSYVIQYPKKIVSTMLKYKTLHEREKDRIYFNLPCDKIIVLCGHTATVAEQYEEMIESLKKCRKDILDKCFFVFMMTYAPSDYQSYQIKISNLLKESNLTGMVLKTKIKYEDMPKLHYACDIHITTIKTDAFSSFLQEELLAGNILIYGKWLNYFEIENNQFFTFSINRFEELTDTFNDVIENVESNLEKSKCNIKGIMNLASEDVVRREWNRIVFK